MEASFEGNMENPVTKKSRNSEHLDQLSDGINEASVPRT